MTIVCLAKSHEFKIASALGARDAIDSTLKSLDESDALVIAVTRDDWRKTGWILKKPNRFYNNFSIVNEFMREIETNDLQDYVLYYSAISSK